MILGIAEPVEVRRPVYVSLGGEGSGGDFEPSSVEEVRGLVVGCVVGEG